MRCKLPKFWQQTICKAAFVLSLFVGTRAAWAFPDTERVPGSGDAPLTADSLTSDPSLLIMPPSGSDFHDRLLIAASGSQLVVIDTETWELFSEQPEAFESTIKGLAFLPGSNSLFASLGNGTVVRVELDDLSADPGTIDISEEVSDAALGPMVIDEDGDGKAYILDASNKKLHILTINSKALSSVSLSEDTSTTSTSSTGTFTPVDIAFADLSGTDKIYISTSNNAILVMNEDSTTFSVLEPDALTHTFTALTVTASAEALLAVDTTVNGIWVLDTEDNTFLDQSTTESGTTPILVDDTDDDDDDNDGVENSALVDIIATDVENPTDTYAYVSGELGLTVADVSSPTAAVSGTKLIDLDEDSEKDSSEPITLSADAGQLAATSSDIGNIYLGYDDSIGIVSENPFVTISSDSVPNPLTTTSTTFTLTFQADEAGTFRVVLDSDVSGESGEELIASTTLDAANTNVTTRTIDINGNNSFNEGDNRVFVFVTDADGNVGWDALDVEVDFPPGEVTISKLQFGNEKIIATFTPLDDEDIANYLVLAQATTASTCPGTIDFEALDATSADGSTTVSGSTCTAASKSCEATIANLTNDQAYCVGIRAIDASDQESTSTGVFASSEIAEETVALSGLLGEVSCQLSGAY